MARLTPPRAAFAASLVALAAAAAVPSALAAFYVTAIMLAGLVGAAFHAYMRAVDDPATGRLLDLAVPTLAALLTVANAAIRFPDVLVGSVPPAAWTLAEAAAVLAFAGWVASEVASATHDAALWARRLRRAARQAAPSWR